MDMLQNLRAFLAVAETGSFSAAARRNGLATSVVTKRVDQLEHAVKIKLFTRTTRTVALTEAGQRWIVRVRSLVADIEDAMRQASAAVQELEGPVRIKAPTTLTVLYIADMLARFQNLYPKVSMEVVLTDRVLNPLDEGFDLVIAAFDATFSGVLDVPLCRFGASSAPRRITLRVGGHHNTLVTLCNTIRSASHQRDQFGILSAPKGPSLSK